jgi:pyruvate dehydrogenase E1 component
VFHAIQYLFGNQTREKLERFRALGGAQSYPSRTKDTDDVDFSTGSVGLGVAMTLFASMVQDYVRLKNLGDGKRAYGRHGRAGRRRRARRGQRLRGAARRLEARRAQHCGG